jgi:hypothetical protein
MTFELSMFADLNSEEMHLLTIEENSPKQFEFSFSTNGQRHHGIMLTFHENNIVIHYYTDTNERYLNLLIPFVTAVKEILRKMPSFRFQMLLNSNYCIMSHDVPAWCSNDLKYNVTIDHFEKKEFNFNLIDSSLSTKNNNDDDIIAFWMYEDGFLDPINFFRNNPPLYLKKELESFTKNYIRKADL